MKIETISIHAGNKLDEDSRAVTQPIVLSSTFERGEDGGYPSGYMYSRIDNPNRKSLENVIAKLENGADCCAFATGNTAGMSVFQCLEPGSHVICPDDMYHGLRNQLKFVFKGIIELDFVDLTQVNEIEKYVKSNTRMIWVETPSNPLLKIADITAISAVTKKHNLKLVVDNTFATPYGQQPLALGADLIMHSTTKYLNGHSDVCGGAVVTKEKDSFWERMRNLQVLGGAVPSPFDCYLVTRGIKTLAYRMRGHEYNAFELAKYLEAHPSIERVFYPGLKSHPQFDLARKQMTSFGGMLSFCVKGGEDPARRLVNNVKIFTQATSLGGVESLLEHRYSIEGPDSKTPKNLIRVSVGLENLEDLIMDLDTNL